MEKLKNRFEIRLVCNKRDYLKWTSKPSYMSQKIFDNDLVEIRKKQKEINTYQTTICLDMYFGFEQSINL